MVEQVESTNTITDIKTSGTPLLPKGDSQDNVQVSMPRDYNVGEEVDAAMVSSGRKKSKTSTDKLIFLGLLAGTAILRFHACGDSCRYIWRGRQKVVYHY